MSKDKAKLAHAKAILHLKKVVWHANEAVKALPGTEYSSDLGSLWAKADAELWFLEREYKKLYRTDTNQTTNNNELD